jgi:hypothetical protein
VAERERLTNRERREQARAERRRQEQEAAQKKQRRNLRGGVIGGVIIVLVGAVLFQAFLGGPPTLDDAILIASTDAEDAREQAGCVMLTERQPLPDRTHFDTAPTSDLSTLYTDTRPTHSGPHTPSVHPVGNFSRQIDEFNSTHNLEHGSIIVWYDPDTLSGGDVSSLQDWAELLNENGFSGSRLAQGGIGIITAPYTDPGIQSGGSIAFRAWGTAMDCDEWDETVAHSFVIDNFGTHGIGPERTFAGFPDDVLAYEDIEVGDTTAEEAPIDGQMSVDDTDVTEESDLEEVEDPDVSEDGDSLPDDEDEDAGEDG